MMKLLHHGLVGLAPRAAKESTHISFAQVPASLPPLLLS